LNDIAKTTLGTFKTTAPEVFMGNYSILADLYSLGCIIYEMLYGDVAFLDSND